MGGGSGSWDNTAALRWAASASAGSYSAWQSANGDNAHFTQAGGTVTIAAGALVAARSLTFAADGYTIAAGDSASKLALTNGGSGGPGPNTIEVTNPGQTATVNATIVGNPGVGLTKTGLGTLVLGGVNAFSGPLRVQQGTLRLAVDRHAGRLLGDRRRRRRHARPDGGRRRVLPGRGGQPDAAGDGQYPRQSADRPAGRPSRRP